MKATITHPTGSKVVTATARRYVVVVDFGKGAFVDYRTDNLATARTKRARRGAYSIIFDTVNKEIVR